MFGVEYLEIPWREKFDFFLKNTWGSIFWGVGKWESWLESFRSKKIFCDPCRVRTEVKLLSWTTTLFSLISSDVNDATTYTRSRSINTNETEAEAMFFILDAEAKFMRLSFKT